MFPLITSWALPTIPPGGASKNLPSRRSGKRLPSQRELSPPKAVTEGFLFMKSLALMRRKPSVICFANATSLCEGRLE